MPTIEGDRELNHLFDRRDHRYFRSLGQAGSVVLRTDCTMCRCIFAITPTPYASEQEIFLVLSWITFRLEGSIRINTSAKRNASRVISAFLEPNSPYDSLDIAEKSSTRGDGLCLLPKDHEAPTGGLHAREVDVDKVNIDILKSWLSTCDRLHPVTCSHIWSEDVRKIRLIDVNSRKVVLYPAEGCDYLALSYKWGETGRIAGGLDLLPKDLPQTIVDAMELVKMLGKQYLWVDQFCIDQSDDNEIKEIIPMMDRVYRGAHATFIALSGDSANAGLPRVSKKGVYHHIHCNVAGRRIVSTGPTLSQFVWAEPWGRRAWTFQEALLSQRCLYISDFGAYFECNAMQCCESLDETTSWVHQSLRDETFMQDHEGRLIHTVGTGVLRVPFVGHTESENSFEQYAILTNLYCIRDLGLPSDCLNAFKGTLSFLQEQRYKEGFVSGLPIANLNLGLLWEGRYSYARRPEFPTWSWASWGGMVFADVPFRRLDKFPVHLRIWRRQENRNELIFTSSYRNPQDRGAVSPLAMLELEFDEERLQDMNTLSKRKADRALCIEAIFLAFKLDLSDLKIVEEETEDPVEFYPRINGVDVWLSIMNLSAIFPEFEELEERQFLLLGRQRFSWATKYHLLVLHLKGNLFERAGLVSMYVREEAEIMEHFCPTKRQIIIV